jgi:hypothetical protein
LKEDEMKQKHMEDFIFSLQEDIRAGRVVSWSSMSCEYALWIGAFPLICPIFYPSIYVSCCMLFLSYIFY